MMKQYQYKNKWLVSLSSILLVLSFFCITSSCEKVDQGDYAFENQVNVYEGTTYGYLLSQKGTYDSLIKVLEEVTWVRDSLMVDRAKGSEITFFAPTNSSFELALLNLNIIRSRNNKPAFSLKDISTDQLDTMISRYIIRGFYHTDSLLLTDGVSLRTLRDNYVMHGEQRTTNASGFVNGGPKSVLFSDTKESIYTRDWQSASTQSVNIITNSGVVHVLLDNHEFGFAEFIARGNN